jgi:hypothetical protein
VAMTEEKNSTSPFLPYKGLTALRCTAIRRRGACHLSLQYSSQLSRFGKT